MLSLLKRSATPGRAARSRSAAGASRGRSRGFLWPVLVAANLALIAGGLALLWPVFKVAGTGLALGMVAAVLLVSLTPLLLLRRVLRRPSAPNTPSQDQENS